MIDSKQVVFHFGPIKYSKVFIIRPGRSRLLEVEKNSAGHLIGTFSRYPDQVV